MIDHENDGNYIDDTSDDSTPFPRWNDHGFFGRRKIVKIHPLHRSSASGLIWFSEV